MPLELLSHSPASRWETPPSPLGSSKASSKASSKPPLLFVHGAWHGAWCWEEHFLPYFAERGRAAHALSLRAHGENDRRGLRWKRIDDYVADVAHVAAQLGSPPVLIGHSMGGLVVQRYLEGARAPAVVLLASVPVGGIFGVMWRLATRHPLVFLHANATWSLRPLIGTPELSREAFLRLDMPIDEVMPLWKRMQDESYLAFLDMLLFRKARPERALRPNSPVLVLGAGADAIFTEAEQRRTAAGWGARAEIFPGMAHDMMLDPNWRAVADRILAWLDERGL
jgi:pimeloyl-ACP methyl ester carboxylesterase